MGPPMLWPGVVTGGEQSREKRDFTSNRHANEAARKRSGPRGKPARPGERHVHTRDSGGGVSRSTNQDFREERNRLTRTATRPQAPSATVEGSGMANG